MTTEIRTPDTEAERARILRLTVGRAVCDISTRCWNWTGKLYPEGYGSIYWNRSQTAHRVVYEVLVGPIPAGLVVDHLCRNKGCVNPDHLEPVTNRENILRGNGQSARNARATHCKRGHPYSGTNLITWRGYRRCRVCFKDSARRGDARYYAKRRAERSVPA